MSTFKVSKTLSKYNSMYQMVDTVYQGTDAMRDAGTLYLPKEPSESTANYNSRLNRSVLFPAYSRTIKQAVGKAFATTPAMTLPESLDYMRVDCDQTGSGLEYFTKSLLEEAINFGISYILVDYPSTDHELSLADEYDQNIRPYFVKINPLAVLDIKLDYINNKVELVKFSFTEMVEDQEGDQIEQRKDFIRLEDGVYVRTYQFINNKEELIYQGKISLDIIPVVPVYGNKVNPYFGTPVLLDLAFLNILHWQKQSDVENILHSVACPILFIKGVDAGTNEDGTPKTIQISPNSTYSTSDSNADIKWVEPSGGGIKVVMESADKLIDNMSVMGLDLTVIKPGTETATGRLLDAAESNSILKSITIDLEWSIYQALIIAGLYLNIDASDSEYVMDVSSTVLSSDEVRLLIDMYKEGLLDAKAVLEEIKARKLIKSVNNIDIEPVNNDGNINKE